MTSNEIETPTEKKDDKMLSDTFQEERCYTTSNTGQVGSRKIVFS